MPINDPRGWTAESLHCPQCNYKLTGLPENRCPECGTAFNPDALRSALTTRTVPVTIRRIAQRLLLVPALVLTLWLLIFLASNLGDGTSAIVLLLALYSVMLVGVPLQAARIALWLGLAYGEGRARRIASTTRYALISALFIVILATQLALAVGMSVTALITYHSLGGRLPFDK